MHTQHSECPLTSCEFKESGCGTPLAFQTYVLLGGSPYQITA